MRHLHLYFRSVQQQRLRRNQKRETDPVAVLRILLALTCAGTVLTVSSRSRNAITAAGISLCIVCLPFCAAMLLLF